MSDADMSKILGIGGGTASGKTTFSRLFLECGLPFAPQIIVTDSYYHSNADKTLAERATLNYDHPDSIDHNLLIEQIKTLKAGSTVEVPCYDFATHTRKTETQHINPGALIIVEGILSLHFDKLRALYDYTVFIDAPDDLRFDRRLKRDVEERGRTEESVNTQWKDSVHPMHLEYCLPTKKLADQVIDTGDINLNAVKNVLSTLEIL